MTKPAHLLFTFFLLFLTNQANAQINETQIEGMGTVGGGLFRPTGEDKSVAKTSPAIQLVASLGFTDHLGAEAEFLYVPILLKSGTISFASDQKSHQISAVVGLRVTSGRIVNQQKRPVTYLALRTGFARIVTQANSQIPAGSWIGRTVDEIENPSFGGFNVTIREKGFVLSPRVGALIPLSKNSALDLSFFPVFIFDREAVSKQLFFTVGFSLAAWQGI
ncbi:MAG: hypothetical protein O2954_07585 [bacterium]|nr:hypothetical protein [bacterium]